MKSDYFGNCMSAANADRNISPKGSRAAEEMQNDVFSSQTAKLAEKPEQYGESLPHIYCNSDIGQSLMDIEMEEEKRIIKKDIKYWSSHLGDRLVCKSGDLMHELYIGQLISMFFHLDASFDDVMRSWLCKVMETSIDLSVGGQVMLKLAERVQNLQLLYKRARQKGSYIYEPSSDYSKSQDVVGQSLNEIRDFVHAPQRIYHKEETENFQDKKIGKALQKKGNSNWWVNHVYNTASSWDDNKSLGNGQGKKYKNKNSMDGSFSAHIFLCHQLSSKADSSTDLELSNGRQHGHLVALSDYSIIFEDKSNIIPKTPGQDLGIEMIVVPESKEHHSEACVDLRKRPKSILTVDERVTVIDDTKDAIRFIENNPVPIATSDGIFGRTAEAGVQTDWEVDTLKTLPQVSVRRFSIDDVTRPDQTRRVQETSHSDRAELDSHPEGDTTVRPSSNATRPRMSVPVRETLGLETEHFLHPPSSMHTTETGNQPSVAHETLLATMEAQRALAHPACSTTSASSPRDVASGTANATVSTVGIVERVDTLPVQATTQPCSRDVISVNVSHISSSGVQMYPCHPHSQQSSLYHPVNGSQASCSHDGRRFAGSASSNNGNDSNRREPLELPLDQTSVFAQLSDTERRHDSVRVYAAGSLPPWATSTPTIDLTRAASPAHIPLRSRRATFIHWPRDETGHQPANMALAGFFFTGEGSTVCCFYCGVQVGNWRPAMNPWHEHVRGQPTCQYLIQMKGEDFVKEIQKRKRPEK